MYNRYIPSSDGTYRRQIIQKQTPEHQPPPPPMAQAAAPHKPNTTPPQLPRLPTFQPDCGDLLVLLILLLLLTDGEEADPLSLLVTMAAFILLR